MTTCLLREEFFDKSTYQIEVQDPKDKAERDKPEFEKRVLVDFCLPVAELIAIINTTN